VYSTYPYFFRSLLTLRIKTWKEMEKHVGPGKPTRFIGISNFNVSMLNELLAAATVKPLVTQLPNFFAIQLYLLLL
jgi:diketogulonate reductase-like aldo/keto reductase